jgi:outer membrane protein assembly factor BamC
MHKRPSSLVLALVVLASLLQPACSYLSKVAPGHDKIDYKKARTTDSLEVPPELSSDSIADAPDSLGKVEASASAAAPVTPAATVLTPSATVQVQRDGDQEWLVVQGTPDQVWPKVREFWQEQGFLIHMEDPRIGILETDWTENRADIPQSGIRKLIGKAIDAVYSSATRDRYRVRLERGTAEGSTEVFLTHRGVEEVATGSSVDSPTIWKPRPSDPELEAEMLKRLMVFLGAGEQQAKTGLASATEAPARAKLVSDGDASMLVVNEDFSRAWRRTGVALDRVGFTVDDRDRSTGTYFVKYSDPLADQEKPGLLSKLAFWSSDEKKDAEEYRIVLEANGADTHVIVNNSKGERDKTTTSRRILTLLEEQLR